MIKGFTRLKVLRKEHVEDDGTVYRYGLKVRRCFPKAKRMPLYFFSVEMILSDGNTTYAEARENFIDVSTALSLFDKLVRNLTTPIDLPYVLEDELER